MNELDLANIIREFLEHEYSAYTDLCGEDDNVNTIPCKKALDATLRLIEIIKEKQC